MAKDVNIHVKTPGAPQAKQQLEGVGKASQRVGDAVNRSGKKGAAGTDALGESAQTTKGHFGKLKTSILSWVTGLFGVTAIIAGITAAIRAQSRAIKEHAQIATEQQKKLLSLQYLGGFFKEHPEARKEVAAYAELGRRPFEEVAQAWYNLRSKAARLSPEQRQSILKEALELGRTQPEAPLDTIVDMFSLYAKQTREQDANRVQNIIQQTITEAGGGAADVAKYMPMFLPVGMAGGLTGPQAAGLWAYVTTQLAEPSMATTGLRATFMALQGRGTPESQKMLGQLGITPEMDFFQKIEALSSQQQAGQFTLGQAELLAGREGAPVLLSMLQAPEAMMETIANVTGAGRGQKDITRDMIQQLMAQDEFARMEEKRRLLDIQIANIKGRDVRALRASVYFKEYEKRMREADVPEYAIGTQLWMEGIKTGVGLEPGAFEKLTTPWAYGPIRPEQQAPVIINDSSMNFYPRVGDDERGPRVKSGVQNY